MNWPNFGLALFGLSWMMVGIYRRIANEKGFIDIPNVRSSHSVVTPRGGGIVFSLLWIGLLMLAGYQNWIHPVLVTVFMPSLFIIFIGFKDDIKSVPSSVRLLVQGLAGCISLYYLKLGAFELIPGIALPYWMTMAVLLLGMLWFTNLMNFMDGSDGLAATEAVFILSVGGYLLTLSHGYSITILCFGLVALLCGFLAWNWPTASIFMGDSGSGFLGFVIALFAMVSFKWFHIPLEIWVILSGAFWFDATVTLFRRIIARDDWTKAHCLHAYQRLLQGGWSHLSVLLGLMGVNAVLGSLAILTYHHQEFIYLNLGLATCFLTVIYLLIEVYKPMYSVWQLKG